MEEMSDTARSIDSFMKFTDKTRRVKELCGNRSVRRQSTVRSVSFHDYPIYKIAVSSNFYGNILCFQVINVFGINCDPIRHVPVCRCK